MKSAGRTAFLFIIPLLLIAVLEFVLIREIGFIYDDWLTLIVARSTHSLSALFSRDMMLGAFYRPFGLVWWWLAERAGLPDPPAKHIAALVLHLLGAGLAGLAVREWGKGKNAAFTTSWLWMASPVAFSCVCWLSCVYDLLAVAFSAAAVIFSLRFLRKGGVASATLSLVFFLSGLLSKESAAALPLLMWLLACSIKENHQKGFRFLISSQLVLLSVFFFFRTLILGNLMGGYAATGEAVSFSSAAAAIFENMQTQAPGFPWRIALVVAIVVMTGWMNAKEKSDRPLFALSFLLLATPAVLLLFNPSIPAIMPLRFFTYGAFVLLFPLSSSLSVSRSHFQKWFNRISIALLIFTGLGLSGSAAVSSGKQSALELGQIKNVVRHARHAADDGRKIQIEPWRSVIGMDAAVKAASPDLAGKVVVLACGAPVHVFATEALAIELNLPWTKRFRRNPVHAEGYAWGEALLPEKNCR